MSKLHDDITETVGRTPIVRLNRVTEGCVAKVYAKLEFFNPLGSVKDRIAVAIIDDAIATGKLKEGDTVVEGTSGNTGIGLAMACAAKGLKLKLVMPESMSVERRSVLAHLGAELVLTPAAGGMGAAIAEAKRIAEEEGAFEALQFDNPSNPNTHEKNTGPEIWEDTAGSIDILVAGVGTGGTITGATRYLKSKNPDLVSIAVEPETSAVMSGQPKGPHTIQGIGAGFIPGNLDMDLIDEVVTIRDEDAFETSRQLARQEGIFCGISCGAAVWVALQVAARPENEGKTIVVILPDAGDRYISTALFKE